MDFDRLLQKREQLARVWDTIPQVAREKLERSFDIEYAHNSTAIEGGTPNPHPDQSHPEDGLSGARPLREIYEVANHNKAFDYVKQCVAEGRPLDEPTVKDIHALLMENILTGGVYRNVEVRITGAGFKPPVPREMYVQVKEFLC